MVKISIIVPVYNVAPYLAVCLDSLLPTLHQDDELLLVQGKSNDGSREISLHYQAEYSQVIVLNQNKTGLSNARNCGLMAARGDYVLFIDSDDFVSTANLSKLLDYIRSEVDFADVWITDYYKHFEASGDDRLIVLVGFQSTHELNELSQIIPSHQCFWNIWKNIYRRMFLVKNKLFFKENTYAEDADFITRLLLTEPTIRTASLPFYHYRVGRIGSLMSDVPLKRVLDTVCVLENSIQQLRDSGLEWTRPLISGLQFEYLLNLSLLNEVDEAQRRKAQTAYQRCQKILYPTTSFAVMLGNVGLHLIGMEGMSKLLWLAKYIKRRKEHRTL